MALPISGLLAFCCCWGPLLHATSTKDAVSQPVVKCKVVATAHQTDNPVAGCCTVQTRAATDPTAGARIRAICRAGTAQASPVVVFAQANAHDDDEDVKTISKEPSVWIGVRMTPVPEPLAAHLGDKGAMIANIVKDSPADKAGLERYDIVVAFDGQTIDDPQDLGTAVADAQAGHATEMTIIRQTEKQKITITPAERRATDKWEYKYEEPEADVIDRSLNLRGHRLFLSPGGSWVMEDLGPLNQVPEMLKRLQEYYLKDLGPDVNINIKELPELPDIDRGADHARVEISVQVDKDGKATTIRRDADGTYHIDKTDADGNKTSETYDNAEKFEQGDPDAYKLYRRSTGYGGLGWTTVWPQAGELKKLRHNFQVEVEKNAKAAIERAKEAAEQAKDVQESARAAAKEAKKAQEQYEIIVKKRAGNSDEAAKTGQTLTIQVDEHGQITVTTNKEGRKTIHRFDSKAEFKASEPELYEKVKDLLE